MHKVTFRWIHDVGRSQCIGTHTVQVLDLAQASQQAKLEIEQSMGFPKGTVKVKQITEVGR